MFPLGCGKGEASSGPEMEDLLSSRKRKDKSEKEGESMTDKIQRLKDRPGERAFFGSQ